MARKAKVKNTRKVLGGITERFKKAANSKEFVSAAKETVIEQSKAAVRAGKNPTTLKPQPKIKSNWHFQRQDQERNNKPTSEYYRPSTRKSTLSYTGQLLDAVRAVAARAKGGGSLRIRLFVNPDRKRAYRSVNGKPQRKPSNTTIVKGQREQGRSVIGISDKTVKTIRAQFISILRRKG